MWYPRKRVTMLDRVTWHFECKESLPHAPENSRNVPKRETRKFAHWIAEKCKTTVYVNWNAPRHWLITKDGEVQHFEPDKNKEALNSFFAQNI